MFCLTTRFALGRETNGRLHSKHVEDLHGWLVLPFGLSNASSIFMMVTNETLCSYIGKFFVVYFDDILVHMSVPLGASKSCFHNFALCKVC